jgi:hypothetical protein
MKHGVPGGKINILGCHNIGNSKIKKCIRTCVLFRAVSEIGPFHFTGVSILAPNIVLPSCRTAPLYGACESV